MNIITSSIKDISTEFVLVKAELKGFNYVVPIQSSIFSFINDAKEITKQNLDLIFPKEKLIGTLEKVSWEHLEKTVLHYLSYCNDFEGTPLPNEMLSVVDTSRALMRAELFWSVINMHVFLPPTKAYFYHPAEGCYFDDYVMWVLCIVLINEETKNGIFVYMAAWD